MDLILNIDKKGRKNIILQNVDNLKGIAGRDRTIKVVKGNTTTVQLVKADGINLFWIDGGVFPHTIASPKDIQFVFDKKPIYVFSFTYTDYDLYKDRVLGIKKTAFVITKSDELLVGVVNTSNVYQGLDKLYFRYRLDKEGNQIGEEIPDFTDNILLAMGK